MTSPLPEKQLRIFLSHLSQQSLTEYLSKVNICKKKTSGRRKMTKVDLIDMIISNKDKSKIDAYDDELSQEEINNILKRKRLLYVARIFYCMLREYFIVCCENILLHVVRIFYCML